MKSLWKDAAARGKDSLDLLVYRSRLIGYDADLCVWGGGNTSTKRRERDHLKREADILWVKGSGSDLKASERKDFAPLRLADLTPLLKRHEMSDEEMVELVGRALVNPKAPRPSIEALLHAFVPYPDIDHSHADAILSLTNNIRGREIIEKLYGKKMLWIPYVKPGFTLAKRMYEAFEKNRLAEGAILENHGIITWGQSSKESYGRMIYYVALAERYIAKQARGVKPFGKPAAKNLNPKERETWLVENLPLIRGTVSARKRVVLKVVATDAVLEFANSSLGATVSQVGPATPDHMLRTKRTALFLNPKKPIPAQLESYAKAHEKYFHRFKAPGTEMLDPFPRIIVVPGVGMVVTGKDMDSAIQCAEVYEHAISVMRGAQAISRYKSLPLHLAFEMEYWPLELYKLSLAPAEKRLARRIALVTGACGAIGKSIAEGMVREGAHVVVCDLDPKKAEALAGELVKKYGVGRAIGLKMDVTREGEVKEAFRQTLLRYGGLDLVVSNAGIAHISSVDQLELADWEKSIDINATGHFLVAREAIQIFKRQGLGGNLIFIATKNVLAPGKDFGAYSASKSAEAQLARICAIEGGEFNIRSNMVNPDGIFEGSGLWSDEIRRDRAKSYGIKQNQLEDFYRKRNLLKTRILPSDVAKSVVFLASDDAAKTTGCILTVDGGVKEAFPR